MRLRPALALALVLLASIAVGPAAAATTGTPELSSASASELSTGARRLLSTVTVTLPLNAICPVDGTNPQEPCDSEDACFHHCCLTTGICPSSSCVSSLDAPNDANANCQNSCLNEVQCVPFEPSCDVAGGVHCLGTIACVPGTLCAGRKNGDICLFDGSSQNFKTCVLCLPPPVLKSDALALAAIKTAWYDDQPSNQAALASWTGVDPCTWAGVICSTISNTIYVTGLSLPDRGLVGTLPAALGDLKRLSGINLGGNALSGYIIPQLGTLPLLLSLNLSSNAFRGPLPPPLSPPNLPSLTELVIVGNADLCGAQIAVGNVGTAYVIGGTALGTPCPVPAVCAAPATACYRNAVLADAPWAWWRLAETSGLIATDCSAGGGNSGTYVGGVTLAGAVGPRVAGGAPDVAPVFDGVSGYVQLPSIASGAAGGPFFGGAFSVEAWVRPTSAATWARFFDAGEGPATLNVILCFAGASLSPQFRIFAQSGALFTVDAPAAAALALNEWHHIVGTLDVNLGTGAGSLVLYVDGAVAVSIGVTMSTSDATSDANRVRQVAYLGRSQFPADALFAGSIAEVALYPTALAAARVAAHYSSAACAVPVVLPSSCGVGSAYYAAVMANSPFAFWRLSETSGAVAHDCAAGLHDGAYSATGLVLAGGPSNGPNAATTAPSFTGMGFVSLPDVPQAANGGPLGGAFTIEAWVNPSAIASWARLFEAGNGAGVDSVTLSFDGASTRLRLEIATPFGRVAVYSPAGIVLGRWTHVVATALLHASTRPHGAWALGLFVDGVQVAAASSQLASNGIAAYDPLRAAAQLAKSSYPADALLAGSLAEVALYGSVLSATDILAHFTAGMAPAPVPTTSQPSCNIAAGSCYRTSVLADAPWAWWRLAESTGPVAFDCSTGGTNSGAYMGGVALAGTVGPRPGSSAALLDGATGFVQLPAVDAGVLSGGAFSVEAWVKPTSPAVWGRIFDAGNGPASFNIILSLAGATLNPRFEIFEASGAAFAVLAPAPLALGVWTHVCATASIDIGTGAGVLGLYVNGALVQSVNVSLTPADAAADSARGLVYIGKSNWAGDELFNGGIAEVALYPTALTAARVAAHYLNTECPV